MSTNLDAGILIATHGSFCQGLIDTAAMILGSLENVQALPLIPGDDPEAYLAKMANFVESQDGNVIILVDVVGGTPYNSVMKLSREYELCAIAGVSLPMLIEAIELRSNLKNMDEASNAIAEVGKSGVQDMTPNLRKFFNIAQNQ